MNLCWRFGTILSACMFFFGCEEGESKPTEAEATAGSNEVRAFIGKNGGTLLFSDTGAKFEISPAVLQERVNISFKREDPSLALSGKDFVGKAYRISPRLNFNPNAAMLYVPVDKKLPGAPDEINLRLFYYDKVESEGPAGRTIFRTWVPHPATEFVGFRQNQKLIVFKIHETISERTMSSPYGLLQAAFDFE